MGDILPQKSGRDFFDVIYAAKHYLDYSIYGFLEEAMDKNGRFIDTEP